MRSTVVVGQAVGFAALIALAGCGGGGGGGGSTPALPSAVSPAPAASAAAVARGTLTFKLAAPSAVASSSARRTHSIAYTTKGIAFTVTPSGGAAGTPVAFSVSAASPQCSANGDGSRTCVFSIAAPSGQSSVAVATYDAEPASGVAAGNLLGTATIPVTVSAGSAVNVPLTLNNVVASATFSIVSRPQLGQAGTINVAINALDSSGATIVGGDPFANAPTVALSDPSGTMTLTTTTVSSPTQPVQIAYNGGIVRKWATLAATITGNPNPAPSTTPAPSPVAPASNLRDFGRSITFVSASTVLTSPTSFPSALASVAPNPSFTPAALTASLNATAFSPVSGTSTSNGQTTTGWTVATAPPVAGAATPIPSNITLTSFVPFTNAAQTLATNVEYADFVQNGSFIDYAKYAEVDTRQYAYATGSYTSTYSYVWAQPFVQFHFPLTAGTTVSANPAQTLTASIVDNRPGVFRPTYNVSQFTRLDGSFSNVTTATLNPQAYGLSSSTTCVDTYTTTIAVDGTYTETDAYSPCTGNYTDNFFIPATTSGTFSTAVYYQTGQAPQFSGAVFYPRVSKPIIPSGTTSTSGPAALDASCSNTLAGSNVYTSTIAQDLSLVDFIYSPVVTQKRYVVPGLGQVCSSFNYAINYYLTPVRFTDATGKQVATAVTHLDVPFYTRTTSTMSVAQLPPPVLGSVARQAQSTGTDEPGFDPTLPPEAQIILARMAQQDAARAARVAASANRSAR